jgi:hypothetical protein
MKKTKKPAPKPAKRPTKKKPSAPSKRSALPGDSNTIGSIHILVTRIDLAVQDLATAVERLTQAQQRLEEAMGGGDRDVVIYEDPDGGDAVDAGDDVHDPMFADDDGHDYGDITDPNGKDQ